MNEWRIRIEWGKNQEIIDISIPPYDTVHMSIAVLYGPGGVLRRTVLTQRFQFLIILLKQSLILIKSPYLHASLRLLRIVV